MAVTDLINTTWRFNDTLSWLNEPYDPDPYDTVFDGLVFMTSSNLYDQNIFSIFSLEEVTDTNLVNVYYDDPELQEAILAYDAYEGWLDSGFKTITILEQTSEQYKCDERLINWLYNNATLISGGDMAVVWTDTPLIKKITLPTGTSYFLADREGREKIEQLFETIAGGVSFVIAWDGASTPIPAKIPAGVKIIYNNTTYTGTMPAEGSGGAAPGAFYLVHSDTQTSEGLLDVYDEYVPVGESGSKTWEKIGDTQVDLSDVVTGVTLDKQTSSVVTGYPSPTADVVLGEATTFALTSGAVTYGSVSYDTFVKSVSAETGKSLVTSSITPAGTSTAVISLVTDLTSKLSVSNIYGVQSSTTTASFATADTTQSTISGFTATTSATYDPTKDILQGTNVQNEVLTIGAVSYASQSTTQFTFSNVTVPIKNTASTTFATGALTTTGSGADIMTGTSTSTKNVATVGTAVTVATGAVDVNGSGAAVVTGITVGASASAVVSMPTASIGTSITVGTNDKVSAVTALGTPNTATVLNNSTALSVTKGK